MEKQLSFQASLFFGSEIFLPFSLDPYPNLAPPCYIVQGDEMSPHTQSPTFSIHFSWSCLYSSFHVTSATGLSRLPF